MGGRPVRQQGDGLEYYPPTFVQRVKSSPSLAELDFFFGYTRGNCHTQQSRGPVLFKIERLGTMLAVVRDLRGERRVAASAPVDGEEDDDDDDARDEPDAAPTTAEAPEADAPGAAPPRPGATEPGAATPAPSVDPGGRPPPSLTAPAGVQPDPLDISTRGRGEAARSPGAPEDEP